MSELKISSKLMHDLKSKNISLDIEQYKQKKGGTALLNSKPPLPISKENEKNQSFNSSSESLEKTTTTLNFKIRPCTPNPDLFEKKNDPLKSAKTTLTSFPNFKKSSNSLEKDEFQLAINEDDDENNFGKEINEESLCSLCNIQPSDFEVVSRISLKVDLSFNSLQNLGFLLPNLRELKLNGSKLLSLRDIGTSLINLEILWASKCCLQDLSGIMMFQNLKELYIAFNQIKDLADIGFLQNLQILDVEGNEVESFNLENLQFLKNLYSLNLLGNPIAKEKNYPACVLERLHALQILDEKTVNDLTSKTKFKEEMEILEDIDHNNPYLENLLQKFQKFYKDLDLNEMKITAEKILENEMQSELNDEDLILHSIKRTKKIKTQNQKNDQIATNFTKNKEKIRPYTATIFRGDSSPSKKFDNGMSNLVSNNDVAFFGNPLKIFKHKRNADQEKNENNKDQDLTKNLMSLIEEFRVEKSSEEIEDLDFDEDPSESSSNQEENNFNFKENYNFPTKMEENEPVLKKNFGSNNFFEKKEPKEENNLTIKTKINENKTQKPNLEMNKKLVIINKNNLILFLEFGRN